MINNGKESAYTSPDHVCILALSKLFETWRHANNNHCVPSDEIKQVYYHQNHATPFSASHEHCLY
jgi:hypothetical protein